MSVKLQASPPPAPLLLQILNRCVSTLISVIADFLKKGFKNEKENCSTLSFSIKVHLFSYYAVFCSPEDPEITFPYGA